MNEIYETRRFRREFRKLDGGKKEQDEIIEQVLRNKERYLEILR